MARQYLLPLLGLLLPWAATAQDDPSTQPDHRSNGAVVAPSYTATEIDGNLARAGLYAVPYSAFGLDVLDVDLVDHNGFDFLDIWADDLFTKRFDGMLQINTPGVPFMARGWLEQASFFGDPTAAAPRVGHRLQSGVTARFRPYPWTSFQLGFTSDSLNQPTNARIGLINYGAQTFYGETALQLGPGVLQLRAENLSYQSRMPTIPSNTQSTYRVGYQAMLGSRSSIGATAQWGNLSQGGARSSLFAFGLTGQYQPARNLWTEARFRFRDVELRPTANAYTAKSTGGTASLTWRPWQRTRFTLGGDYTSYERLDAVQAALERPNQLKFWVRGDYRGPKNLRLIGEYQYRALDNLSLSAVPLIGNASPLYADLEHRLSLRASSTIGAGGVAYGFWQWREQSFDARAFDRTIMNAGAGVSYPLLRNLQVTADLYYLSYDTNAAFMAGTEADGLVSHIGLSYQPDSVWRLWTDYHRSDGYAGENADSGVASAGVAANLGDGRELQFRYSRDDYTNQVFPGLAYDTDLFNFRYVQPF